MQDLRLLIGRLAEKQTKGQSCEHTISARKEVWQTREFTRSSSTTGWQSYGRGVHADNKQPDMQKADNHALMCTDLSGRARLAGQQARKCTGSQKMYRFLSAKKN
jgi:hypothetical protein